MIGLYVYKHEKTETIEAAWSMTVWHEEGRKIVLTKPDVTKPSSKNLRVMHRILMNHYQKKTRLLSQLIFQIGM